MMLIPLAHRAMTLVLVAALTAACTDASGPSTGTLALTVTGLPSNVAAAITVSGPTPTQPVTQTARLSALSPGSYTIAAAQVSAAGVTYTPVPASQSVSVAAGATATATIAYTTPSSVTLALQPVASGFESPVYVTSPPNDARLFVVEQTGRIRVVANGQTLATPFLDIRSRITSGGERGLLSLAFDPQYATSGYFFVYFTDSLGNPRVERLRVSGDANVADPASATLVITAPHPTYGNHNGGLVAFGPDGMLYAGLGDGGGAGDPFGNAQNRGVLLGKLLRLDVSTLPYRIPSNNPFAGQSGARGEIWAYGLRNPWRWTFDPPTSQLYIADVGQGDREEIDVVGMTQGGLNFGWNIMEGTRCYLSAGCDQTGLILPVLDYDHTQGCAITGGYVYRGTQIPELTGTYFYSDYCGGWLRSLRVVNGAATEQRDWHVASVGQVTSFGRDAAGELYLTTAGGTVYRLARGTP